MTTFLTLIAAFGASATLSQPTQPTTAPEPKAVSAEPSADEKKICRKLPSTGTRMEKTACMTRKQWDKLDREGAY